MLSAALRRRAAAAGAAPLATAAASAFALIGDDHAVAEGHHAIGIGGNAGIVRHYQHREPALAVEPAYDLHDLGRGLRVEIAGRLVGEQDRGLVDQRARDRDALLLAARELVRIVLLASL